MGNISNKYDIEDELKKDGAKKTLPNMFLADDEPISFKKAFVISLILHPVAFCAIWLTTVILMLLGINLFAFDKPAMAPKDVEFVLVTREAPPVDPNTKNRADINSRAGGIHDPKRKVSEPSPAPAPKKAASPAPQAQPTKQPPKPQPQKMAEAPKPSPAQPAKLQPPAPSAPKPSPVVARPGNEIPKPQMPKLAQNPKSAFSVEVPKNTGPVGTAPSQGTGTASSGGSRPTGSSPLGTGTGGGMPSPKLGASSGGSTTGGGSKGSTGGLGTGNLGNPSPGNPAGAPGVDAIRQPDWGPYMRELERRIKRNWNPPKGDSSKRVVVYFKISRDGKLLSINVAKSSGVPLADQAAKAAIELTAPFAPLPPEFKGNSIDIDFTFDYNVLGASYR